MTKRGALIRVGSATLVAGLTLASTMAFAQTPDQSFYFNGRPYDPLTYYTDGPPDTGGCVKECMRDFSPCDSAMDKKIDGRCNRNHGD